MGEVQTDLLDPLGEPDVRGPREERKPCRDCEQIHEQLAVIEPTPEVHPVVGGEAVGDLHIGHVGVVFGRREAGPVFEAAHEHGRVW